MAYKPDTIHNAKASLESFDDFINTLPKQARMAFYMEYVLHASDTKDWHAAMYGLDKLFGLCSEYSSIWRMTQKTYANAKRQRGNHTVKNTVPRTKTSNKSPKRLVS